MIMNANELTSLIARLEPTQDPDDAISTLNQLIDEARAIEKAIGGQHDQPTRSAIPADDKPSRLHHTADSLLAFTEWRTSTHGMQLYYEGKPTWLHVHFLRGRPFKSAVVRVNPDKLPQDGAQISFLRSFYHQEEANRYALERFADELNRGIHG